MEPLVSVVIPTHQRSHLVGRAVQSALAQSLKEIEVIVVIDGSDESTERALASIVDERLRVVTLEKNQGAGVARNIGAENARAEWIAFLDDDDEWMPEKLAVQLAAARQSTVRYPIIACRLIMRRENRVVILPRRTIAENEPLSEYLFCRSGIFWGDGLLQTSTVLTKTDLVRRLPYSARRRGQDIEWLLRAAARSDVKITYVTSIEPLAIWNISRNSYSPKPPANWRTLDWATQNFALFTPRAYAAYLLLYRSQRAARTRDPRVFFNVLRNAFQHGKPRWLDVLIYCGIWLRLDTLGQKIVRWRK
jgi:glycosyltransferase involved in cell wall biosynthesis